MPKFLLFNSQGVIAANQRHLIIEAVLLMLFVVIPLFALAFGFAWKYRVGNKSSKYTPNWDRNKFIEWFRFLLPATIIAVLAVMTWKTAHSLDPFKPIAADVKPITVQVVALRWKWLFIYPQQNIASVNFLEFPANTPLNLQLTADAPMSSFWIPQLGGQMYAMAGMSTQLHLMSNSIGQYQGSAAEINGKGFAGMSFSANAVSASDFQSWVSSVKKSKQTLTLAEYSKLAEPSENNTSAFYSSLQANLYDQIILKYMAHP